MQGKEIFILDRKAQILNYPDLIDKKWPFVIDNSMYVDLSSLSKHEHV